MDIPGAGANGAGEIVELVLPRGRKVLVRKLSWLRVGLLGIPVVTALGNQAQGQPLNEQQSAAITDAVGALITECLVSPRISFAPNAPDEVHPKDFDPGDLMFIVGWAVHQARQKTDTPPAPEPAPRRRCKRRSA